MTNVRKPKFMTEDSKSLTRIFNAKIYRRMGCAECIIEVDDSLLLSLLSFKERISIHNDHGGLTVIILGE